MAGEENFEKIERKIKMFREIPIANTNVNNSTHPNIKRLHISVRGAFCMLFLIHMSFKNEKFLNFNSGEKIFGENFITVYSQTISLLLNLIFSLTLVYVMADKNLEIQGALNLLRFSTLIFKDNSMSIESCISCKIHIKQCT